ncbi:DUF7683 domain-containing protein [Moritella yayanosii]|uniref:DUF7683 domain-containing protein n=1 Tax=Moritella yayanosii TaxID=69539 RepID=A0A330LIK9_9GAMM|nr:hypothetical protein [Moritella yayanosii]SQD76784.1 protein of unknown function [Moritella yayanosii]
MIKVTRVVEYFNKENDEYVDKVILADVPLNALQDMFGGRDADDPLMYYVYAIDKTHEVFFSKYVDINFEFDKFDYFLDCYRSN